MATSTVEGFSISHAAILDATTGLDALNGDIYGVSSGGVALSTDSYDNTGDDATLSTWYWFNFADITVQAGYIPFDLLALISGATIVSSGTAPADYRAVPLWDEDMQNTAPLPMLIRVPSKDSNGVVRDLDFILYKVNFQPFSFEGPAYKDGLKLNYTGRAVRSNLNERGQTLVKPAIGRLISRPQGTTAVYPTTGTII